MKSVEKLLRELSGSGRYKGFHYLALAVKIVSQSENELHLLSKSLYPKIAEQYGTTAVCVERNIRTVIASIWERGNHDYLNKIANCVLVEQPTVSEMIDFLSDYVRRAETK